VIVAGCVEPAKAWKRNDGFNAAEVDMAIVMESHHPGRHRRRLGHLLVCAFDEPKAKEILACRRRAHRGHDPMGYPAAEPVPFVRQPLRELVRKNRW